jgi:EAL and modified HD-GYP domain-containing signal transduction protein
METFVARQPIFDRRRRLCAYELLFREGPVNAFPGIDGDAASAKVLSDCFLGVGLERLTGGHKAFVNFTGRFLLQQVPALFPRDQIVVEVLEDVVPDRELITACRALVARGYTLALDDFVYREELRPLVELASIVKIDFRNAACGRVQETVAWLAGYPAKLLAEKVETGEEFARATAMGFTYFQGYFFSRPEVVRGRELEPSQASLFQVLAEVHRQEVDIARLEALFKTDLAMAYKLLCYINSAFFHRGRDIESIRHAIVLLGLREVRQLVALLMTARLAGDKPDALVRSSIVRARFCERLGQRSHFRDDGNELFLLGLFSLMDAILDMEMPLILERLPLGVHLKQALLQGRGPLARFLEVVQAYESGCWDDCLARATDGGICVTHLVEDYLEAIGWADALPLA